jgi:hypothetical protein
VGAADENRLAVVDLFMTIIVARRTAKAGERFFPFRPASGLFPGLPHD